jgi:hypothetical protein
MRYLSLLIAPVLVFVVLTISTAKSPTPNVGPKADVAAVIAAQSKHRTGDKFMRDMRIDGVHVVGNYALFQWFGDESAGFGVYKRTSGEVWKQLESTGGAESENELARLVQSKSLAHELCSGWPKSYSPCSSQ